MADELARKGSNSNPIGPEPTLPIPWATIKREATQKLANRAWREWKSKEGMRHSKAFIDGPSRKFRLELLSRGRNSTRMVAALLTGHGPFSAHLAKIGVSVPNQMCRFCELWTETGWHVLAECPAVWKARLQHLEATQLHEGMVLRPGAVARFAADLRLA